MATKRSSGRSTTRARAARTVTKAGASAPRGGGRRRAATRQPAAVPAPPPAVEPSGWDPSSTVVVVNSAAAGGRVGREWRDIALDLTRSLGDVHFVLSRAPGHCIELASEAVEQGARTILSLGGDGTHNEVVNGILRAQHKRGSIRLGVLPAGTGGDFRRLLEHNGSVGEAARAMPTAAEAPIDAGLIRFVTDDGRPAERYFVNIASLGVSGLIDRAVNRSSKRLGGKLTFLLATLQTLPSFKPPKVRLWLDGEVVGDFRISTIAVCNGRFAGGSMNFAPTARLGDGLFDVTVLRHAPLLRSVPETPKLYDGTILDSVLSDSFQGRTVKVEPLDERKSYVDIDGEAPGVAPAEFELIPHALRLLGARRDVL